MDIISTFSVAHCCVGLYGVCCMKLMDQPNAVYLLDKATFLLKMFPYFGPITVFVVFW